MVTGNPVRGGFAKLAPKWHVPPLTLLTFGGSQGSRIINRTLTAALPRLPGPDKLRIVHQTGPASRDEVAADYNAAGRKAEVLAFLDDMERALRAQADLVLAAAAPRPRRAGRGGQGRPCSCRSRLAADDHQRGNARALEAAGAARDDRREGPHAETAGRRAHRSCSATPAKLTAMDEAARQLARPDAAARVADLLEGEDGRDVRRHPATSTSSASAASA